MDRFKEYVSQLFQWNEEMRTFLRSEQVGGDSELWEKLDRFAKLMENLSGPLTDQNLLDLQSEAETIHDEMERYFNRKQEVGEIWVVNSVLAAGGHVLPELPYEYNALEPYLSEEIMKLHHQQHHRAYVQGFNQAELMLKAAREQADYSLIKHWSRELAFHGSGHNLHTIFWNNMSPNGTRTPKGRLLKEIESYFGSFSVFKKQFAEVAIQVEGNGWAILVWSPRSRHLEIVQTEKHMHNALSDSVPLLVLDVWEHAYYLQYSNKRADYVENWWNIVNWDDVERRHEQASELRWQTF